VKLDVIGVIIIRFKFNHEFEWLAYHTYT